jgi:tetratricopeptide (TPR) repeat protein
MRRSHVLGVLAGLVLASIAVPSQGTTPQSPAASLRPDLAGFHRAVTTALPEAQRFFDQGLTLYYGFNDEGAVVSFARAAALDPRCAMAYWGEALAVGPNINNPTMDEAASKAAWKASRRALALVAQVSPVERALIEALAVRYASPPPADRHQLDVAYADAMRSAWKRHPDDPDVGALFAESLMDLYPWKLWTPDGSPSPVTPEIMATLEAVMARFPDHLGANHFYIHTMEASPMPEKALPSADRLRGHIPAVGHLVHMPAHIDIRLGHYDAAIEVNLKAIAADRPWAAVGGFYTLYRAHNYHFLAYAAMFAGRREMALHAARQVVAQIPIEMVRAMPDFLDAFYGVPYHVLVRFGLWERILAEPAPPADLLVTRAFWRYARTVALSALGRVPEAEREMAAFRAACAAVPESRLAGNNPARTVLGIGLAMAEGELEYRKGHFEEAFTLLREGVRRDDALHYDEPWGWMMPVRHSLGALLLEQGRVAEAEAVYRADLRQHPANGWALHGLAECLHREGRADEAAETTTRFREAWAHADIAIKASCYCRTKT